LRLDHCTWSFNWQKSSQVALNKKLVAIKSSKYISKRLKNIIYYNEFIPYYKIFARFCCRISAAIGFAGHGLPVTGIGVKKNIYSLS